MQLILWQIVVVLITVGVFHLVLAFGVNVPVAAAVAVAEFVVLLSFVVFEVWGTIEAAPVCTVFAVITAVATFAIIIVGGGTLEYILAAGAFIATSLTASMIGKYRDIRFSWILVVLFTESTSIFAAMFFGGMTGIGMAAVGIVILVLLALFGKSRALRYHSPA